MHRNRMGHLHVFMVPTAVTCVNITFGLTSSIHIVLHSRSCHEHAFRAQPRGYVRFVVYEKQGSMITPMRVAIMSTSHVLSMFHLLSGMSTVARLRLPRIRDLPSRCLQVHSLWCPC